MTSSQLNKHHFLLVLSFLVGLLYTLVNLYPDVPILTLNPLPGKTLSLASVQDLLSDAPSKLSSGVVVKHDVENDQYYFQFQSVDQQMQAKDYLNSRYRSDLLASPNLRANYPAWMRYVGASPMKLGLDLRGGVHLTLNVDVENSSMSRSDANSVDLIKKIQPLELDYDTADFNDKSLVLSFASSEVAQHAIAKLQQSTHFDAKLDKDTIVITPNLQMHTDRTNYIMQKTLESIHRRVNELGLSEAVIQRQGQTHINIDLPGIQDIQRAKDIIGNTATLSFHIVTSYDPAHPVSGTDILLDMKETGSKLWLDAQSVLSGDEINFAISSSQQGKPIIQLQLSGGPGEELFYNATARNKGKHLAIVYQESMVDPITGERTMRKNVISAPRINSALRGSFVIEGMRSNQEAETLALLLRSGSLAAPIDIVHETTVGPSMGEDNIQKGIISIGIGFLVVIVFMLAYYRLFGVIANLGLLYNLVLIVTCLSFLDATISLPSMAAIVLTVGMAVDANVLINERIREEIRLGSSISQAISQGYDKAFATILDANVTSFIVSIVLYGLGSGMIKGFAVTLIIGLFCSMVSSVYATKIIAMTLQPRITNLSKAIGI